METINNINELVATISESAYEIKQEVEKLKKENEMLRNEVSELEEEEPYEKDIESVNLGLDTLEWRLLYGNIVIQQEIEDFIESLKNKYGLTPS